MAGMQLKDLECQLAQAQLNRYLRGAALSPDALEALESHIGECQACQAEVSLRQQELTADSASVTAAVLAEAPIEADNEGEEAPQPRRIPALKGAAVLTLLEKLPANVRPVVLSTALALLLVALSTIAKDPTKVFGERLASGDKKVLSTKIERGTPPSPVDIEHKRFTENVKSQPAQTKPGTTPTQQAVKPTPSPASKRTVAPSTSKPAPTRRTAVRRSARVTAKAQPARRTPARTVAKPAPKRVTQPSGIVVYDEKGNRI